MDLSTMLARLNSGQYPTTKPFISDLQAIVAAAEQRWGSQPGFIRELSFAHQLLDEGMRAVDTLPHELVRHCEAVEARGGVEGQRPEDFRIGLATGPQSAKSPPGKHTRWAFAWQAQ